MPEYRRAYLPGGTFFFTVVTYARKPVFAAPDARAALRSAWLDVESHLPFATVAVCLLPDHLHSIWTLPEEDANYSMRWREIKRIFSRDFRVAEIVERNASRLKRNEVAVWQRRFWEHTIRDERDLDMHLNYLHYNPVKHGLVAKPTDWPWSSFHRYVRMGFYTPDWGVSGVPEEMIGGCGE